MIDINLLPPEYGPKKIINPYNLAIIGILSIIAASLIFSSIRLISTVQLYSERIQYYDEQIKGYRLQVEDIHELGLKVKLLKTRLSLVQELLKEKTDLSDKIYALYQCIPSSDVWIDALNVKHQKKEEKAVAKKEEKQESTQEEKKETTPNDQAKGSSVEIQAQEDLILFDISGVATSVDNISQFIANLEDSEIFENVVFGSTIKGVKTPLGNELMSFSFTVQVMVPNIEL